MRETSFGEEKNKWFDSFLAWMRQRRIAQYLKSHPGPISIVDLGCGYGAAFLQGIVERFPHIAHAAGVDVSVSKNLPEKIRPIEGDLNKALPLPDSSFDFAISLAVLEHLSTPELAAQEMYRILKPGGMLFLTTPAPASKPILEFLSYRLHLIDEAEIRDHKHYFSRKELRELFGRVGFKNIRTIPFQLGLNSFLVGTK